MPAKKICDACGKKRRDVRPWGEGTVCFLCRREHERHRVFDFELDRYVHINVVEQRAIARYEERHAHLCDLCDAPCVAGAMLCSFHLAEVEEDERSNDEFWREYIDSQPFAEDPHA